MTQHVYGENFGGTAAENYQRYFVPSIGAPLAADLVEVAAIQPGERVLDVACGTGVVTRLAAQCVGAAGSVAGLDVTPGMLAVARAETPDHLVIAWHEAGAESMPFPDCTFDLVLCQMGLQFMPDKPAALREMRRVLATHGRVHLTVPGPKPHIFAIMTEALTRHLGPEAAAFGDLVFSLHEADELTALMRKADFNEVRVSGRRKTLRLPPPEDFLWQYICSTPIAEAVAQSTTDELQALERDVCLQWRDFEVAHGMSLNVCITTASAVK